MLSSSEHLACSTNLKPERLLLHVRCFDKLSMTFFFYSTIRLTYNRCRCSDCTRVLPLYTEAIY